MRISLCITCWLLLCSLVYAEKPQLNVVSFGAVGDGLTLNTVAIQKTIQAALQEGADVLVPSGIFVTGQIELYSGVHLVLDNGAELYASDDPTQYQCLPSITTDTGLCDYPLIFSNEAVDVGITGYGSINGGANDPVGHLVASYNDTLEFFTPYEFPFSGCLSYACRPKLVVFKNTRHVTLKHITLKNSALWTTTLAQSKDVHLDNVTIYGDRRWPNNDGVDIMSSSDVIIRNSRISTGDDSIAIITHTSYACSNITVVNCNLSSSSAAIKLSADEANATGNISDLIFNNINISDTNRGICVDPRWGSCAIINATFINMQIQTRFFSTPWWGSAEPIYVTSMSNGPMVWSGSVSDFYFANISILIENGIMLYATDSLTTNFVFENVDMSIRQYTNISRPAHDFRPAPPPSIYYAPINAFFFNNVSGVVLSNVTVKYLPPIETAWGGCFNSTGIADVKFLDVLCEIPNRTIHGVSNRE